MKDYIDLNDDLLKEYQRLYDSNFDLKIMDDPKRALDYVENGIYAKSEKVADGMIINTARVLTREQVDSLYKIIYTKHVWELGWEKVFDVITEKRNRIKPRMFKAHWKSAGN